MIAHSLTCDSCGRVYARGPRSGPTAPHRQRELAAAEGWVVGRPGDGDECPACQHARARQRTLPDLLGTMSGEGMTGSD